MAVGTQDLKFNILAQVVGAQAIDGLTSSMSKLQGQVSKAGEVLKTLAGLYGAKEAIEYGKTILDTGDQLIKLSQKTGASVEQLAKLREEAAIADVPFDALTNALKKLSVNLIASVNGNQAMAGAFQKLGISARDSTGNVKNAGDVLLEIQTKFSGLKDGPEKAALAVQLFGKAGSELIPLLNSASTEVSRFSESMTTDFASRAEQFNDSLKIIGGNLKANTLDSLKELLPTLQELATAFKDLTATKSDSLGLFDLLGESARILAIGLVTTLTAIRSTIDVIKTEFKQLQATFTLHNDEVKQLGRDLDDRTAKRLADLTAFVDKVRKNSVLFGQGTADQIHARQSIDTQPEVKAPGTQIDATGINDGAKIIKEFEAKLAKIKAETEAYGQSNAVKQQAILLSELESKGLNQNSAAYQRLAGEIVQVTDAAETAKDVQKAKDYLDVQREGIDLKKAELQQTQLSRVEYEKLVDAKKLDLDVTRQTKGMTAEGARAYEEASAAIRQENADLIDLQDQQRRTWVTGAQSAFKDYLDNARDVAAQTKALFMHAFSNMEDSLVSFVKTGKLNFAKFADDLINDIIRIQVRAALANAIIGVGSLFASSSVTSGPGVASDAGGTGAKANYAAGGGVMTDSGMMALNKYARGGVATSPQMAVFGEGSMPEAYVPLPDGRTIPVSMKGSGGGDTNVNVNINMESGAQSGQASGGEAAKAQDLGRLIASAVRMELVNQRRPGGILNS